MIDHYYPKEPIDRESQETTIAYDAKDKKAYITTCDKKMIKKLLQHEEDITKIFHYPNGIEEYHANIEKKRVRLSNWKDPLIKTRGGNPNWVKKEDIVEDEEEAEEEDGEDEEE